MSCNSENIINVWSIDCAKFCSFSNEKPIANYVYTNFLVEDNSQFFDNNINGTQYNWKIFYKNQLIYDFGYGNYNALIPELSNTSIYNRILLGTNNEDIFNFIDTIPNFIINSGDELTLHLKVKDSNGYESNNVYKNLNFSKYE